MPRYRLSIAVALGLLPLVLPPPAEAARGSFVYWPVAPGGEANGPGHRLNDPATGPCQDLVGADETGAHVVKVENDTDTPAVVYENRGCTGHRLVVGVKETRSTGGHGPHSFDSVKFKGQ